LRSTVTITNLAQHPAHGLVNKVFIVFKQQSGNLQRRGEFLLPDIVKSTHDGNTSLPQTLRTCQGFQYSLVMPHQPRTQNQMRGTIRQVPAIHLSRMLEIKLKEPLIKSSMSLRGSKPLRCLAQSATHSVAISKGCNNAAWRFMQHAIDLIRGSLTIRLCGFLITLLEFQHQNKQCAYTGFMEFTLQ